jgi:hypothetical protein
MQKNRRHIQDTQQTIFITLKCKYNSNELTKHW